MGSALVSLAWHREGPGFDPQVHEIWMFVFYYYYCFSFLPRTKDIRRVFGRQASARLVSLGRPGARRRFLPRTTFNKLILTFTLHYSAFSRRRSGTGFAERSNTGNLVAMGLELMTFWPLGC